MSSPEAPLRVFYISTTIACIGFLLLFAQTVLAMGRQSAIVNSPDAPSTVTPGDEAQDTTSPDSKSPRISEAESGTDSGTDSDVESEADSKEAATKLLRVRIKALNSEFSAAVGRDTTLEIIDTVCTYLKSSETLLKMHLEATRRAARSTDAELNFDASIIIRCTTSNSAPLGNLGPSSRLEVSIALLTGTVSVLAAWTAFATYAVTAQESP